MKIKISYSNRIEEITLIDPDTNEEITSDFIGNFDGFDYDEDNEKCLSQENFEWWNAVITCYQFAINECYEYKKTLDDSEDFDENLALRLGQTNLEDMPEAIMDMIREHRTVLKHINLSENCEKEKIDNELNSSNYVLNDSGKFVIREWLKEYGKPGLVVEAFFDEAENAANNDFPRNKGAVLELKAQDAQQKCSIDLFLDREWFDNLK